MSFNRQVLHHWLKGVIEMILFLPLLLIAYVIIPFDPTFAVWIAFLAVFYLIGSFFAQWLRYTYIFIYVGLSLVSSVGAVWLIWGLHFPEIVLIALCNLAFYRGCLLALNRWADVLPMTAWWIALGIYFLASIFFSRYVQYDEYMLLFMFAGFFSLIATLWRTNVLILHEVNLGDRQPTRIAASVLRHNRIAIFTIIALIVIVTFLNIIQNTMFKLFHQIKHWFVQLLSSGPSHQRFEDPYLEPPAMSFPVTGAPDKASLISTMLQLGGYVLTAIILVIIVVVLGRKLIRWSASSWEKLASLLRQKGFFKKGTLEHTTTSYVDEEQKLMTIKDIGKQFRHRLRDWFAERMKSEPRWSDLSDNKARVRYLYRHWLLRKAADGVAIDEALTPREVGEQQLAMGDDRRELVAMYDAARYGGDSPRTLAALRDDAVARERERNERKR